MTETKDRHFLFMQVQFQLLTEVNKLVPEKRRGELQGYFAEYTAYYLRQLFDKIERLNG